MIHPILFAIASISLVCSNFREHGALDLRATLGMKSSTGCVCETLRNDALDSLGAAQFALETAEIFTAVKI